ncbi:flavin reductase (NADPH)-like [Liolophura sinensis]|uniref:flavin reductase (NADPH)-like n=1 Tax=Liolophura sinensis TaxID=3198878 RepID=UPI00315922A2
MKLAVLGATGPSGQELVKDALARGHQVIALVRSPEKLAEIKHDNLQVHRVDIFNPQDLAPHFKGCDAVLSGLGQRGLLLPFTKTTFYEDSVKSIVTGMREANITRFLCITSWCTEYGPDNPKIMEWIVKPLFIGRHLTSMAVMENYLFNECPDINYTIVRPPQLTNGPSVGTEMHTAQGQFVPKRSPMITRADVAKFMLNCLTTDQWDRKAVSIAP